MELTSSICEFGRGLFETGDLDPLYTDLHHSELSEKQLKRWILGYACLYHGGVASYLSEREDGDFWEALDLAARNVASPVGERWPRGKERRHWRAANATASVKDLRASLTTPEGFIDCLIESPTTYTNVLARVRTFVGFGPWIGFKLADMLDRLGLARIDFSVDDIMMYDAPRKAALLLNPERAIAETVADLVAEFSAYLAPPLMDRAPNIQEIETVLCKWKSHRNGHYPVGNDIHEIREDLAAWAPVSATAARLKEVHDRYHK